MPGVSVCWPEKNPRYIDDGKQGQDWGFKLSISKKVLVTGGAGFIGSHLCERLVAEGDLLLRSQLWRSDHHPYRLGSHRHTSHHGQADEVHGADARVAAAPERDPGSAQRKSPASVRRADEALQGRGCKSPRRLSPDAASVSGVHRSFLRASEHNCAAPCALHALDHGPFGA